MRVGCWCHLGLITDLRTGLVTVARVMHRASTQIEAGETTLAPVGVRLNYVQTNQRLTAFSNFRFAITPFGQERFGKRTQVSNTKYLLVI